MSLPPRKQKPAKRSARWKSPAHLAWIRSFFCAWPGCPGMPIEAAHVRIGSGAGMGEKPSDFYAVPLCRECHSSQHSIGERTFWEKYQNTAGQTVEDLIEALCKASPKAMEIRNAKRERENG